MSTKEEQPSVSIDTQKLDDWNGKFFQLDRRMARKLAIQKEMASDVNEIKQLKLDRKKQVTDQLEAIKQTMSQVEKIPGDKGEVTQAITAYQASKSTLLKLLTQDLTADAASKADAAVKK